MPKGWMQEKIEIEKLLNEVEFGFLGMIQGVKPYVIPMTFAYEEDKIYLHAALRGLKIDCIREIHKCASRLPCKSWCPTPILVNFPFAIVVWSSRAKPRY